MSSVNKNGSNWRFSHDILFFEDTHEYLVDGKPVPSVTEILSPLHRSYAKVNPSVLEYAANRGKAVHEALEVYDLGGELEARPEAVPYVQAYLDWHRTYSPNWLAVEKMVFCEEGWFIGTLDRMGYLNDGKLAIVDIKTSQPTREAYVSVCLQTMAYAMAAMSEEISLDYQKINRYGLFLMKDGKYRLLDCKAWEGTNHIDSAKCFATLLNNYKMVSKLLETGGKK